MVKRFPDQMAKFFHIYCSLIFSQNRKTGEKVPKNRIFQWILIIFSGFLSEKQWTKLLGDAMNLFASLNTQDILRGGKSNSKKFFNFQIKWQNFFTFAISMFAIIEKKSLRLSGLLSHSVILPNLGHFAHHKRTLNTKSNEQKTTTIL